MDSCFNRLGYLVGLFVWVQLLGDFPVGFARCWFFASCVRDTFVG